MLYVCLIDKLNSAPRVRTQLGAHGSWRRSGGRGTTRCSGLVRAILVYLKGEKLTSFAIRSRPTIDGV